MASNVPQIARPLIETFPLLKAFQWRTTLVTLDPKTFPTVFQREQHVRGLLKALERYHISLFSGSAMGSHGVHTCLISDSRCFDTGSREDCEGVASILCVYRILDVVADIKKLLPASTLTPEVKLHELPQSRLNAISFKELYKWNEIIKAFLTELEVHRSLMADVIDNSRAPSSSDNCAPATDSGNRTKDPARQALRALIQLQRGKRSLSSIINLVIAGMHLSYIYQGEKGNLGVPDLPSDLKSRLSSPRSGLESPDIDLLVELFNMGKTDNVHNLRGPLVFSALVSPIELFLSHKATAKPYTRSLTLKLSSMLSVLRRAPILRHTEDAAWIAMDGIACGLPLASVLDRLVYELTPATKYTGLPAVELNCFRIDMALKAIKKASAAAAAAAAEEQSTPPTQPNPSVPGSPGDDPGATSNAHTTQEPGDASLGDVPGEAPLDSSQATPGPADVSPPPSNCQQPTPPFTPQAMGATKPPTASSVLPGVSGATVTDSTSILHSDNARSSHPSFPESPLTSPPSSPEAVDTSSALPATPSAIDPAAPRMSPALIVYNNREGQLDSKGEKGEPKKRLDDDSRDAIEDWRILAALARGESQNNPIDIDWMDGQPHPNLEESDSNPPITSAFPVFVHSDTGESSQFLVRAHTAEQLNNLRDTADCASTHLRSVEHLMQESPSRSLIRLISKSVYETYEDLHASRLQSIIRRHVIVVPGSPSSHRLSFQDALACLEPSEDEVVDVYDHSISPSITPGNLRHARIADFIASPKILSIPNIPIPFEGSAPTPFTSERAAFHSNHRQRKKTYTSSLMTRLTYASAGKAGVSERWQIAPHGHGKVITVVEGRLWLSFARKPDVEVDFLSQEMARRDVFVLQGDQKFNGQGSMFPMMNQETIVVGPGSQTIIPPNTVHRCYYVENSVIKIRNFYPAFMFQAVLAGMIHMLCLGSVITATTVTYRPCQIIHATLFFYYEALVLKKKMSAELMIHLPGFITDIADWNSVTSFFSLINIAIYSNAFDTRTYAPPALPFSKSLTPEQLRKHDLNAIPEAEREDFAECRGIAITLVKWFFATYTLIGRDKRPFDGEKYFWKCFFAYQAAAIHRYKRQVEQNAANYDAPLPAFSADDLRRQLAYACDFIGVESAFQNTITSAREQVTLTWVVPYGLEKRAASGSQPSKRLESAELRDLGYTKGDRAFKIFTSLLKGTVSVKRKAVQALDPDDQAAVKRIKLWGA